MIKRIIGILASLAVLALVVYTAMGVGSYSSLLPDMSKKIASEQANVKVSKKSEKRAAAAATEDKSDAPSEQTDTTKSEPAK